MPTTLSKRISRVTVAATSTQLNGGPAGAVVDASGISSWRLALARLSTFMPVRRQKGAIMPKLSLSKMVCIVLVFCAATAISSPAQTILGRFVGDNGAYPRSLVQGNDGNFYGITISGDSGLYAGTVFKITHEGG